MRPDREFAATGADWIFIQLSSRLIYMWLAPPRRRSFRPGSETPSGDAMTPWEIQGRELINCNCSYGCPCQFNALPTQGFCEANGAIVIDKGHYGNVRLDGLKVAIAFHWPGPIHE